MHYPSSPMGTDSLLSPKETQQRERRAQALKKIDTEIQSILTLNHQQQTQFRDLSQELATIENLYQRENQELKEEVMELRERCEELEKLYLATKEDLIANVALLEEMGREKARREREVAKLKAMVRNQEGLIDQYKKSIGDELELERELMKATLEEERAKMEREFNHALAQMERQYEQKVKKLVREIKVKDCQSEFQDLRRYLQSNKENHDKPMKKSPSYALKIISEYSTADQESREAARHNQAVFLP